MGDIAQITFAISVGAWGVVILVDPVGKQIYTNGPPEQQSRDRHGGGQREAGRSEGGPP